MCNFRIKELTVTNYRKFEQETFPLNPTMNVFAGKNGSGKTAALEAAVVMMGAYLAAYQKYVPSRNVFNLSGNPTNSDAHKKVMLAQQDSILTTGSSGLPSPLPSCTIRSF